MNLEHEIDTTAVTLERLENDADDTEAKITLYVNGEAVGFFGFTEPDSPYDTALGFVGFSGKLHDLPPDEEVVLWSNSDRAIDTVDYCRECHQRLDADGHADDIHVSPENYFAVEVVE